MKQDSSDDLKPGFNGTQQIAPIFLDGKISRTRPGAMKFTSCVNKKFEANNTGL